MDLSVVIPTFRRPRPLAEAIESALRQEGVTLEIFVVDDSPEGAAREVVQGIGDPRVSYRCRAVPTGGNPGRVRNDAWPDARGRIVHFLDDDDRVVPGAYREVLAAFDRHPASGVVYGVVEPFGEDPAALAHERRVFGRAARRARLYHRLHAPLLVVANQLFGGSTLHVNSACFIRREHLAALGGYDEQVRVVEDLDLYVRAIRAYGCVFLDRTLVEYRTGTPSLMHNAVDQTPLVATSYRHMYGKYRAAYGAVELLALKVVAKAVLQWI